MGRQLKIFLVNIRVGTKAYSNTVAAYTVNEAVLKTCNKLGVSVSRLRMASTCIMDE